MPLDPEEHIYLTAAQGFVGLKMYLDADAELDRIDPFCRHLPEVLAVRVQIYERLERWELMEAVAKRLVESDSGNPEWRASWAQATSQTDSLDAARRILLSALDDGLDDALIHFNLACCECRLGDVEGAKEHLKRCFDIDPGWKGWCEPWAGIFGLPDGLSDGDIVTICSPVDRGYLEVRNHLGEIFTVAMQEIDCGTLYEVSGTFLPPQDRRVSEEVTKQRALGFRHRGFEERAARIGRLKNPPLRAVPGAMPSGAAGRYF